MTATTTVAIKADPTQALSAITKVKDALAGLQAPKAGYKTTEFWVTTVAPIVLTVLTFLFHRDFSAYVPAVALVATCISTAAYAISRAHLKRPVNLASLLFDVEALTPLIKQIVEAVITTHKAVPATSAPTATPLPPRFNT